MSASTWSSSSGRRRIAAVRIWLTRERLMPRRSAISLCPHAHEPGGPDRELLPAGQACDRGVQAPRVLMGLGALVRQGLVVHDPVGDGERLAARSLARQRLVEIGGEATALVDVAELLRRDPQALGELLGLREPAELGDKCGACAHHIALRTPPRPGNVIHRALAVQHCAACTQVGERCKAGAAAAVEGPCGVEHADGCVLLHVVHVHRAVVRHRHPARHPLRAGQDGDDVGIGRGHRLEVTAGRAARQRGHVIAR